MKMKHKQMGAFLLATTLLFSMAGCGSNSNAAQKGEPEKEETAVADTTTDNTDSATEVAQTDGEVTPGWQQHADDKVKLTWYINFSWFTTPWGQNAVSKKITEETGIDIEFVVPAGNEAEKLNSLIASDTLPDLITLGYYEQQVPQIIDAGLVYPLDELATEYDPYFYQVASPESISWYTQDDGHFYGYPNSSFTPADSEKYDNIPSNQTFLVRKDMYEAIGSPDMTTPEGFTAALKAAKEKFPEVNGQPLIPFGAHEFTATGNNSFDEYLENFLAIPYEKDGKYYDRNTDPELIRWLKTFRQLNEDGYLADDIFIDKRAQMEEKLAQGRYFCMMYQRTDFSTQEKMLYEQDPNSIYIAIDGPKNSKGEDYRLPNSGISGWTLTMISKNCERPDRAIELMSYLMSEHGQHMTWLGVEGEHWDMVDGVPTMRQEYRDLLEKDQGAYGDQIGGDSCFWMLQNNAMELSWKVPTAEPLGQMERWTFPYTISNSEYVVTLPADSEEADIQNKIKNEWGVVLPKLLLASSEDEFDQILADYIKKRDEWGNDKVIAKETELMNINKQKLGL